MKNEKENKGPIKQQKQSVWEAVIAEVTKATNTAESNLIFLGFFLLIFE